MAEKLYSECPKCGADGNVSEYYPPIFWHKIDEWLFSPTHVANECAECGQDVYLKDQADHVCVSVLA